MRAHSHPKSHQAFLGHRAGPQDKGLCRRVNVCVRLRGSRARGSHATRVITTTTKKCEWFGQTTKARDRAIGQGSDARMRGGVPKTIEEEFIYKVKVWMECIEHQRTILCAGWWWWSWWWFNGPWPIVYTRNARPRSAASLHARACASRMYEKIKRATRRKTGRPPQPHTRPRSLWESKCGVAVEICGLFFL